MSLFDLLRETVEHKTGKFHIEPTFNDSMPSPYLYQRWVSMTNATNSFLLCQTSNKLYMGLDDDKEMWYKLMVVLIEKRKFKKINYIKRAKKDRSDEEKKMLEKLSVIYDTSIDELDDYIDEFSVDLKSYKDRV